MPHPLRSAGLVCVAALGLSGCLLGDPNDPAAKYSISVISRGEVIADGGGRRGRGYFVNYNTRPGEVEKVIRANPGLGEALRRNRVDLARVAVLRVRPTNVVEVYTR